MLFLITKENKKKKKKKLGNVPKEALRNSFSSNSSIVKTRHEKGFSNSITKKFNLIKKKIKWDQKSNNHNIKRILPNHKNAHD